MPADHRKPIILHTDIGSDIDDSWALAQLLESPHFRPLLVLTDTGDTMYRAAVAGKLLEQAGRTDVELAAGRVEHPTPCTCNLTSWIGSYRAEDYPGRFTPSGIDRLIELAMDESQGEITLVSIGPLPSLAEALRREPRLAPRLHFVGMFGSLKTNHDGKPNPIAEYNVRMAITACQEVFAAPWKSITITPLDTCGRVRLSGALYQQIAASDKPLLRAVLDSYRAWLKFGNLPDEGHTSILFDTVAIHLAHSHRFLQMEKLKITVRDDGFTVIDNSNGHPMLVATAWSDLPGYQESLTGLLCRPGQENDKSCR
ncbi:MAG: nucleoside hydrolase [Oligosphaeraceae bacterium]|nr:nucleoside hydrolase [Oligosphaeraceae bacterium]